MSGEPDMETSLACLNNLEYIAAAIPSPVLANFTNRRVIVKFLFNMPLKNAVLKFVNILDHLDVSISH